MKVNEQTKESINELKGFVKSVRNTYTRPQVCHKTTLKTSAKLSIRNNDFILTVYFLIYGERCALRTKKSLDPTYQKQFKYKSIKQNVETVNIRAKQEQNNLSVSIRISV